MKLTKIVAFVAATSLAPLEAKAQNVASHLPTRAVLVKEFKNADKDQNLALDLLEYINHFKFNKKNVSPTKLQTEITNKSNLFKLSDANNDGALNIDEFIKSETTKNLEPTPNMVQKTATKRVDEGLKTVPRLKFTINKELANQQADAICRSIDHDMRVLNSEHGIGYMAIFDDSRKIQQSANKMYSNVDCINMGNVVEFWRLASGKTTNVIFNSQRIDEGLFVKILGKTLNSIEARAKALGRNDVPIQMSIENAKNEFNKISAHPSHSSYNNFKNNIDRCAELLEN